MNRREFTKRASMAGGALLIGGGLWGGLHVRQAHARSRFTSQLLGETSPLLTEKAVTELRTMPAKGREEISRYFPRPVPERPRLCPGHHRTVVPGKSRGLLDQGSAIRVPARGIL